MKVLVYEHVTGGGYAEKPWEPGFASQGFAMMNTMVSALASLKYHVHILYDKRINKENLPDVDKLIEVSSSDEWKETLSRVCDDVDYALIIAPEDDMILPEAIRIAEKSGVNIAGPNSESASVCSNKVRCLALFQDLNLEIPQTLIGKLNKIYGNASEIQFPAVLKESISSGASSLLYLQQDDDLTFLLEKPELKDKEYILQEYADGTDASVSLIVDKNEPRVLTVNLQKIQKGVYGTPSKYLGGECPLDHPASEDAKKAAVQIAESIPGLQGYIGIDFVLRDEIALPMEINPRLTVSSIGVSRVISPKILASFLDKKMIDNSKQVKPNGYAVFTEYTGLHKQLHNISATEFKSVPGVVSPPVVLEKNAQVIPPYLSGWGTSIQEARKQLVSIEETIMKRLGGSR